MKSGTNVCEWRVLSHLSSRTGLFCPVHRGSRFLQNVFTSLPDYTASQSRYSIVIADWSQNVKSHISDGDCLNSWHTRSFSTETSLRLAIYSSCLSSVFAPLRIQNGKILKERMD